MSVKVPFTNSYLPHFPVNNLLTTHYSFSDWLNGINVEKNNVNGINAKNHLKCENIFNTEVMISTNLRSR